MEEANIISTVNKQAQSRMPRLRRLERLIIYSYLPTKTYARVRALSKSERKLTCNSAIARENKELNLDLESCVKHEDARIKFLLDCVESCAISIRTFKKPWQGGEVAL